MFAVKVGDEVGFGRCSRYTGYQSAGFSTVIKVNGHGHITLADGKVFDKYGDERKKTYGVHLIPADDLRTSQALVKAERDQAHAVRTIEQKIKDLWSYSGTVHVTPERKAELLALVGHCNVY
jgi:hypothetical protein